MDVRCYKPETLEIIVSESSLLKNAKISLPPETQPLMPEHKKTRQTWEQILSEQTASLP